MAGWMAAIQAAIALYGASESQGQIGQGISDIKNSTKFNPQNLFGPMGTFMQEGNTNMRAQENAAQMANRGVLSGMNPYLLSGGMANDPGLVSAMEGNNIGGAFQNAQGLQSLMMGNQAFGNLGQMQQGLLGAGGAAFGASADQSQLINQNLAASNALAAPGENDLINRVQDRLFAQGRLGSTGGSQEFGNTIGAIQNQRNQRVLGAQQLGLQQQGQLQNFGLGAFNQAAGIEGQGFGQGLQALQQNQSSGQNRLQNAMGLFGFGRDTMQSQFGLGLQGQQGMLNQDQYLMNSILGLMNSENGRIGAMGMSNQAMANLYGGGAAGTSGMMGGLSSALGGMSFGG